MAWARRSGVKRKSPACDEWEDGQGYSPGPRRLTPNESPAFCAFQALSVLLPCLPSVIPPKSLLCSTVPSSGRCTSCLPFTPSSQGPSFPAQFPLILNSFSRDSQRPSLLVTLMDPQLKESLCISAGIFLRGTPSCLRAPGTGGWLSTYIF